MKNALEDSYAYCRRVARRRARNFYYAFRLLPRDRRDAICAMYAFMRYCDDLSDEPGSTEEAALTSLARWRCDLEAALKGEYSEHPLWPAFHDTVQRYRIPQEYFPEMIEGVSSDLRPREVETFQDLYHYCYQVASVAGLTAVHIFGFESEEALPLAEKCGIAFQLTNILRDVGEDAECGRVYLPSEDLERFHVDPEDLSKGRRSENFIELMRFEASRARSYYEQSSGLVRLVHPPSRAALLGLIRIYSRLLDRIEECQFDVLGRRVRLSALEKCCLVVRAYASASRF